MPVVDALDSMRGEPEPNCLEPLSMAVLLPRGPLYIDQDVEWGLEEETGVLVSGIRFADVGVFTCAMEGA